MERRAATALAQARASILAGERDKKDRKGSNTRLPGAGGSLERAAAVMGAAREAVLREHAGWLAIEGSLADEASDRLLVSIVIERGCC